jgi:methionine biosynthesis protein MetW
MKRPTDIIKSILKYIGADITNESTKCIAGLLEYNNQATLLDVGCGDGKLTLNAANAIGTTKIYGIDIIDETIERAKASGIDIRRADLNHKFPFENESFDVVLASEIIEHLSNTDSFLREIYRILRAGGYTIISTPNLSSWPNIIFLLFGKQPAVASVSDEVVVNTWHAHSNCRLSSEGP